MTILQLVQTDGPRVSQDSHGPTTSLSCSSQPPARHRECSCCRPATAWASRESVGRGQPMLVSCQSDSLYSTTSLSPSLQARAGKARGPGDFCHVHPQGLGDPAKHAHMPGVCPSCLTVSMLAPSPPGLLLKVPVAAGSPSSYSSSRPSWWNRMGLRDALHWVSHHRLAVQRRQTLQRPEPALGPCWPHIVGGTGPALGELASISQSGRASAHISAHGLLLPL